MYRALLPEGQIECESFDRGDHGVELYDEQGTMLAFVPYPNLEALVSETAFEGDEHSIM